MDFRFRGKSGRAADIADMIESDPERTLQVRFQASRYPFRGTRFSRYDAASYA
jgi:hypothetical protein